MEEFDMAIRMAEESGDKVTLASVYIVRGMRCFQTGEYLKAISDFDDAIIIMKRILNDGGELDENELAKAYAGRGMAYYPKREPDKAMQDFDKCIEIWERLQLEGKHIEEEFLIRVYAIRSGIINTTSTDMGVAISGAEKSIEIAERRQASGEEMDYSIVAYNYLNMGVSCDQKGVDCEQSGDSYGQKIAFEEANTNYSKCIETWKTLRNNEMEIDYDSLATAYMNRGSNYYHEMGEIGKALLDYNEAVRIREKLEKNGEQQNAFDMFMVYKNRSQAFEADGDVESAINDVIPALQILKGSFSSIVDFQPIYYSVLEELIELIEKTDNKALLHETLQEFLHAMCQVPKILEAEMAHNKILERLQQ